MSNTLYFFSKEDLINLLEHFGKLRTDAPEKNSLQGFILNPGFDEAGVASLFPYPLYTDGGKVQSNGDLIITNTTIAKGCPYPPGYGK